MGQTTRILIADDHPLIRKGLRQTIEAETSFEVIGEAAGGKHALGLIAQLSSGGALTGTPTARGTYNFTVKATDGSGCTGMRSYTVIVSGDGLMFYPLPRPVRLMGTRAGQGNCDDVTTPIASGTSITTPARLTCEGVTIPTTAQSVLGNVTVINQTSQAGCLTLCPDGVAAPLISNMVYFPGDLLANAFVVGLNGGTGQFRIFAERTLDAVVDVSGYFAP